MPIIVPVPMNQFAISGLFSETVRMPYKAITASQISPSSFIIMRSPAVQVLREVLAC